MVRKIAQFQTKYALLVIGLMGLIVVGAFQFAGRLTIASGFEHLLPQGRESVLELERVTKKTAGVSTLFVVLEAPSGSDPKLLRAETERVTAEIRAVGDPWVGSADSGIHEAIEFFKTRGGLYADLPTLKVFHDDVVAYFDYEAAREAGTLIDDSEPAPPKPDLTEAGMRKRFAVGEGIESRYPGGYFESADGLTHVVLVRSKIMGGDLTRGTEAIGRIRDAIGRVGLETTVPGMKIGFSGDLYSGVSEVSAINKDVTEVGLIGAVLLTAVVLLYYLRLSNLLMMVLTVVSGLIVTGACAYFLVGTLNTATGFVFTIIAGNGINTAIIFMARYLEVRRGGADIVESLAVSHRETFLATLCAAIAAGVSFLSLKLTYFRGFQELGLIGGVGLIVCWIVTILLLPSLIATFDRWFGLVRQGPVGRVRGLFEQSFGKPFGYLVVRLPKTLAIGGIAVAVIGFVALIFYVRDDPFEHDMGRMRNDSSTRVEDHRLQQIAQEVTGYVGTEGMAILVDRIDQVEPLREALYKRRDEAPPELRPFDSVVALEDFVPADQTEKIPLLLELKKRVKTAKKLGAIAAEDWPKVEGFLPPDDLAPITLSSLPEGLARSFTEVDGTRGRIVYIVPISPEASEDARYLLRWADAYRRTVLPDESVVLGSGRAVIYADMWAGVMESVPIAILVSFASVSVVVLVSFRGRKQALMVLGTLILGLGWMGLGLVLFGVKLNFLNFVALPITFGIGVDYAVNVVFRAMREEKDGALIAVRETGGAVVLASLTTMLGYVALVGSMNLAVRSLGIAAVIGEVCALLPAMLVLPALMHWVEERRAGRKAG